MTRRAPLSSYSGLVRLSKELGLAAGTPWANVFEPIGLMLVDSPERSRYHCTPANSRTFAGTGGDGVHFGFLVTRPSDPIDQCPIVMTVPMQFDEPNYIVGANLGEFLCLGMRNGYFALEQLAYDLDSAVRWCSRRSATLEDESRVLLAALTKAFDLKPWTNIRSRLTSLRRQHRRKLKLAAPP